MKRYALIFAAIFVGCFMVATNGITAEKVLKMSTTTSTQASGLLDILLPEFQKDTGIKVKVIAKGTGAIILGPEKDPAGVKGQKDVVATLKGIAAAPAMFISRGDDSGTHTKEQNLWKASGLKLEKMTQTITKKGKKKEVTSLRPANSKDWYMSIGQGMGKTLTYAEEKQAYTMSDRGTYIKYKFGKTPALDLVIISEGDANLANPYGVIPVNPAKHPDVQFDLAGAFAKWITSEKGQKLIADYRLEGKQLFYPDAM